MTRTLQGAALALALGWAAPAAIAQEATFGTEEDTAYAALLWEAMIAADMAGDAMVMSFPYQGVEPHGMLLETFYLTASVDGHEGDLIVKRNYGPEGVSVSEVLGDPATHLGALTVMFRREEGYDPENQDWFWAKYLPDGTLDQNPAGMALAGRVAKGADQGCIACHSGEADYLFTTDHLAR